MYSMYYNLIYFSCSSFVLDFSLCCLSCSNASLGIEDMSILGRDSLGAPEDFSACLSFSCCSKELGMPVDPLFSVVSFATAFVVSVCASIGVVLFKGRLKACVGNWFSNASLSC